MPWQPIDEDDEFPTLGYDVADWMMEFLLMPDRDDESEEHIPFVPTQEQIEFLARLYELDPDTGRRVKQRAVLSRPRGWGKSPFLAAICCAEAMGPVLCDGWDSDGQPVGVPWSTRRTPIVQVTATTDDQTGNTWDPLLEMLRGSPAESEYGLDPMDSFVALRRGRIEKRTSSATSVKGAKAVMAVMDQTETWLPSNGGPKLAKTLRSNADKLGGLTIETPNAYTIGERSVAETTARFYEPLGVCTTTTVRPRSTQTFPTANRSSMACASPTGTRQPTRADARSTNPSANLDGWTSSESRTASGIRITIPRGCARTS